MNKLRAQYFKRRQNPPFEFCMVYKPGFSKITEDTLAEGEYLDDGLDDTIKVAEYQVPYFPLFTDTRVYE